MPARLSLWQLLRLSAGLLVWASAFVWLYAGFSLGCQTLDVPVEAGLLNPVTIGLLVVTLVHLALLAGLLVRRARSPVKAMAEESERSRTVRHQVEGLVLWVSMAGLLFVAFPILMLPPCAG